MSDDGKEIEIILKRFSGSWDGSTSLHLFRKKEKSWFYRGIIRSQWSSRMLYSRCKNKKICFLKIR
jgi:hypothetical protein